jgi:FixJ family two-component response regulator
VSYDIVDVYAWYSWGRVCDHANGARTAATFGVFRMPWVSIIDDDESVRFALDGLVRSLGYEARTFASAEEFLGCSPVDGLVCVITDIHMPGMSGIELKQHLTARRCSLPVIMITGRNEPDLEERARSSGAACFLKKPFEPDVLIGCLEKALTS